MIETLWALGAIILIDVVLGGENAIVIALASRRLPPHLRKRAIGAVAVRFACVAALTWLLLIPGLRLVGGLALLYIAWTLVRGSEETEHEVAAASTFWGAMATIVWADAVMGLDNALGIAAAAGGNWLLIIFGLLVSVPIILFGSTVISRLLKRWPRLIWVGGGVLVVVALQMIWAEPLLQELISASSKQT
jgi:YjbE family integral membrane protein